MQAPLPEPNKGNQAILKSIFWLTNKLRIIIINMGVLYEKDYRQEQEYNRRLP